MSPTNSNLYQCRLCLKRTPTRVNVFGGDFPKMLDILTSIKVSENDGLPRYSCTKCAQDVKMALIVKKRIIKAHKTLLEMLKNKRSDVQKPVSKIIVIDDTPDLLPLPVLSTTLNSCSTTALSGNDENSEQILNPIEFVNADEEEEKTSTNIKVKSECEEISVDYNELRDSNPGTGDEFLHRVIEKVMKDSKRSRHSCEICDLTFPDRSSYSLHSMKHKKSKCHICDRLIRSDNIRKHIMLHSAGPSTCNYCGAICKNIESLRGHIFYQHKSSSDTYVCEECGKNFRVKYKFLLHKKKDHIGLRNFKCEICGKAFFTNGNLNTHINMTHKKLRPYICEFCGTGFSSAYALKTHKRQHTNEKPFKCQHCEEGFRQRVSLRSHMKSKHGIEEPKEHWCKMCDKGFATVHALGIHQRLHAMEKCQVCSEAFAEKELLRNHLKEAHNITTDEEIIETIIKPDNDENGGSN